jgi:adenine-specific DNA-methyltransferase
MHYIDSKTNLLSWINKEITARVGDLTNMTFCDLFAGSGAVGRAFKNRVKKIISNDIEEYAYTLNRNYIKNIEPILNGGALIAELNRSEPIEGLIYNNYCEGSGSGRLYFTDQNGRLIDAIRAKIDEWRGAGKIDENAFYFLLASLIESADKVANVAAIYGAFLKRLKGEAKKAMRLTPASFELCDNEGEVYKEDANALIKRIKGDVLYLDPPYNHRQYGANYHLLNTIALNDVFEPQGKTGLREYYRSDYCQKGKAQEALDSLFNDADFEYIFLSYNNEGAMSEDEIKVIMSKYGRYEVASKSYRRYNADNARDYVADETREYLHILQKN